MSESIEKRDQALAEYAKTRTAFEALRETFISGYDCGRDVGRLETLEEAYLGTVKIQHQIALDSPQDPRQYGINMVLRLLHDMMNEPQKAHEPPKDPPESSR